MAITNAVYDEAVHQRLEGEWRAAYTKKKARRDKRLQRPLVRLWDGDWVMRGYCEAELSGSLQWALNNTGVAEIALPVGHYLANWALDPWGRPTQNIHLTADKDGARWSGRLQEARLRKDDDGRRKVVLTFLDDIEELKYIDVWPNPFLPSAIQFPRAFLLAGPAIWTLKTTLFLNLMRLQNSLFTVPDDPLDFSAWVGNLSYKNWPIIVKPTSFFEDGSQWSIVSSRFKTFYDLAKPVLDDGQLMLVCRRWLTGDPQPWEGADLSKNGQLVVDIVDKSGVYSGTAQSGNMFTGLLRTITSLADNLVDETMTNVTNPVDPYEHTVSKLIGTHPKMPWVYYRDDDLTGVQSGDFVYIPGTAVHINTGGHSMPGVNEGLSIAVQLAGDLASSVFLAANVNLGQVADTLLAPIYEDTLLAWNTVKSINRAQKYGWSHYYEHFQDSADRGYTLSALMALRQGMWETRSRTFHTIEIADASPYLIGDNGEGHWWLGDRIGSTLRGLPGDRVVIEQCSELEFKWDDSFMGWRSKIGQSDDKDAPIDKIVSKISGLASAVHDLGVI